MFVGSSGTVSTILLPEVASLLLQSSMAPLIRDCCASASVMTPFVRPFTIDKIRTIAASYSKLAIDKALEPIEASYSKLAAPTVSICCLVKFLFQSL